MTCQLHAAGGERASAAGYDKRPLRGCLCVTEVGQSYWLPDLTSTFNSCHVDELPPRQFIMEMKDRKDSNYTRIKIAISYEAQCVDMGNEKTFAMYFPMVASR